MELENSKSQNSKRNLDSNVKDGTNEFNKEKKTPHWKYKVFCLYMGFTILGFAGSVTGPALVDLEELYGVTTKEISVNFVITGLGYLLGAVLCGIVYERLNYELQFTIALFVMGCSLAVAAWMPVLPGFIAVSTVQAMSGGFIDSAGQAYILHVMKGRKYKEPVMQGAHAAWSFGSTIGPFVIQPFLVERNIIRSINATGNFNITNGTTSLMPTDITFSDVNVTEGNMSQFFHPSKVQFGYLLCGCITAFTAMFYVLVFCIGDCSCLRTKENKKETEKLDYRDRLKLYIVCLGLLIFWFAFQVWIESTLGTFVATFAIKELGWSKDKSAWVTSALWAGQFAGRLASVPIAVFLRPRTMVYLSVTGTAAAMAIMLALVKINNVFYWIACTLAGFAQSSAFGSMVLWASQSISITGPAASVFIIGACSGGILGSFVVGQLLEQYSPMIFVYFAFGASMLQVFFTLAFEIFTKFYRRIFRNTNRNNNNDVCVEEEMKQLTNNA